METVAPLVRAVIRAFYSDEYAVLIEPLLSYPYYLEDDEQPKGPLSQKLGGISSTRLRKTLAKLEQHSLIQKKEVLVQGQLVDLETQEREGSKIKRIFYYIDFVHFVKIITLRLSQIREVISSGQRVESEMEYYFCPNCEDDKTYDAMDASMVNFTCPECGTPLSERPTAASGFGGPSTKDTVEALLKKFGQQISGESDQRDSITEFLQKAQNAGPDLPENDPARSIQQQENEKRRLEAEAQKNQEALPDVGEASAVVSFSGEQTAGALAPWLQKTITGQITEDALRDQKEREAKRARSEHAAAYNQAEVQKDEYLLRYEMERQRELEEARRKQEEQAVQEPLAGEVTAPATKATDTRNPDAVFTFADGRTIRAGDINEDNLNELSESCSIDEYDAFIKFLKDHAGVEVE